MAAIIEKIIGNEHDGQIARCEQHDAPLDASGFCPQCEFEANAERCGEHGLIVGADGLCPECDAELEALGAREEDAWLEDEVDSATPKSQCSTLEFPRDALVGSIGDFAKVQARGSEVPVEFYFAAALTVLGAVCGDSLKLTLSFDVEPRLYTVLHGESYSVKKSTAVKRTFAFFGKLMETVAVEYGVASAEGLARILRDKPDVLLFYDELQAFVQKSQVKGSTLLPMVTSLFEQNHWHNATKNAKASFVIDDAHLSVVGCCTSDTYARMWNSSALAIGLLNRLFIVNADRRERVAWPSPPSETDLNVIRGRIKTQLDRLPNTFDITSSAKKIWQAWYENVPPTEHARRLDTIGLRLLALIALTTDKDIIDDETVQTVIAILDYELAIRTLTDPIDADNKVASLEENIRRQLDKRGPLTPRELRQHTHADRNGLWAFDAALKNLSAATDIKFSDGKYHLVKHDV